MHPVTRHHVVRTACTEFSARARAVVFCFLCGVDHGLRPFWNDAVAAQIFSAPCACAGGWDCMPSTIIIVTTPAHIHAKKNTILFTNRDNNVAHCKRYCRSYIWDNFWPTTNGGTAVKSVAHRLDKVAKLTRPSIQLGRPPPAPWCTSRLREIFRYMLCAKPYC